MPSPNFMLADLEAVALALLLFGLFAFVPGFVVAQLTNVFSFREATPTWKSIISVPLSLALFPILNHLLGRFLGMVVVWCVYGTLWLVFLALLWRGLRAASSRGWFVFRATPDPRLAAAVLVWIVLGLFLLVDLQFGDQLYFPVLSYDYSLRVTLTDAITRTGIPPTNPLFYPGHPVSLRYHYFWQIVCSLVDRLGGSLVSARQAVMAGTLWCGLALLATAFLWLRFLEPEDPGRLRRKMILAAGLFTVTGLDLVPTLLLLLGHRTLPEMEWWNDQVTSWIGSVLWVPHHVVGLVAGLTGFLILWTAHPNASFRLRMQRGALAGLALAGAAGSSIYVSFVLAVFLGFWMTAGLLYERRQDALMLASAGLLALILSTPYLTELSAAGAVGGFLRPAVRTFLRVGVPEATWPQTVFNLLALPLNYFLEFGFFFLVAVLRFRVYRRRAWRLSRADLCMTGMVAVSILVCTFFRSGVIRNNDLGYRGVLLAQFVLLIWAVDWLDSRQSERALAGSGMRILLRLSVVLGVAGSLYSAAICRLYPVLSDAGRVDKYSFLSADERLGRRTYALRQLYETLRERLPSSAIVQHDPNTIPNDMFFGLYSNRQAVADSPSCGAVFGGDPADCDPIYSRLNALFSGRDPEPAAACRDLGIDVLVVKDTDPVWKQPGSWVWTRKPLLSNGFARAFACPQ